METLQLSAQLELPPPSRLPMFSCRFCCVVRDIRDFSGECCKWCLLTCEKCLEDCPPTEIHNHDGKQLCDDCFGDLT